MEKVGLPVRSLPGMDEMKDEDSLGFGYLLARGEIHRPNKDQLLRKHKSNIFLSIKNESGGIEDD